MIVYFRFFLNFLQFELKENFLTFVSFQRIRNRISFVIMLAVNTNMRYNTRRQGNRRQIHSRG